MSDYMPDPDEPNVPYFFYERGEDGKLKLMRRLNGVVEPGVLRISDVFQDTSFEADAGDYDIGD